MDINVSKYMPVGDVCTIIICLVNAILLKSTYTIKQKNFKLFTLGNSFVMLSAIASIAFYRMYAAIGTENVLFIYLLSDIKYITLLVTFVVYSIYIKNLIRMSKGHDKCFGIVLWLLFFIFSGLTIASPWTGFGMVVSEELDVFHNYFLNPFACGYIAYAFMIGMLLVMYRKRFITQVRRCIETIMVIAFAIMMIQIFCKQVSYTCFSFTLPIIATLFLFHYNAYDIETGTLDIKSYLDYVKQLRNQPFAMISMTLKDLTTQKVLEMTPHFYHFNEQFFNDGCTFRVDGKKMILIYKKNKNPKADERIKILLEDFKELYEEYKLDYKLIILDSDRRIKKSTDYLSYISMVEEDMGWNQIVKTEEKHVDQFLRMQLIHNALEDIADKHDLDDERVKVYCQPVLNTESGKFYTAEALMRIELPMDGMIFPDEFIPIAERQGLIHSLSLIILNKTCKQVASLIKRGFVIERVSVNFSITELRDKDFCDDLVGIIKKNNLEPDKIAIELTESRNEKDFELVKSVILRLHSIGVKVYLDDFGTGYSNFERIMGLPIDIIKFDRSMTIMSGQGDDERYLVGSLANIFVGAKYQILFEGIEDEDDERRCQEMHATLLQGYKYSRPIPIEQLEDFLDRE